MNGRAPYPRWALKGYFDDTNVCPRTMVTPRSRAFLRLYSFYQDGYLYCPGSIRDQPALYLEAIEFIRAAVAEMRETVDND